MKFFSHLNTATEIIQVYDGREPLHNFLKKFYGQYKKYGSKDRRRISHLCYVFFRIGKMVMTNLPPNQLDADLIKQAILAGLFLCSEEHDELLHAIRPGWNEKVSSPVIEKVAMLNTEADQLSTASLQNLFPWTGELSTGIDKDDFILSFLQQPDLFLRIRQRRKDTVIQKLSANEAEYELIPPFAIRLPNGSKVDQILNLDQDVVVQDLNSQNVGNLLEPLGKYFAPPISVWDCCAASGGKSIMAKDILPQIELTVSDVRESILVNLKKRFAVAGIGKYRSFVADLSTAGQHSGHASVPNANYDVIIADLPCTGSGTWSRTPEQLYFFDESSIARYSELQKRICKNIIPHLKRSGKLLYVTCSVFKRENEEIIAFLKESYQLKVEKMELLKGYDKNADTMFAALLSWL